MVLDAVATIPFFDNNHVTSIIRRCIQHNIIITELMVTTLVRRKTFSFSNWLWVCIEMRRTPQDCGNFRLFPFAITFITSNEISKSFEQKHKSKNERKGAFRAWTSSHRISHWIITVLLDTNWFFSKCRIFWDESLHHNSDLCNIYFEVISGFNFKMKWFLSQHWKDETWMRWL